MLECRRFRSFASWVAVGSVVAVGCAGGQARPIAPHPVAPAPEGATPVEAPSPPTPPPETATRPAGKFVIDDPRVSGNEGPNPCETDATLSADDRGYVASGVLHRAGGKTWIFCTGARHTWRGNSHGIEGVIATLVSDASDPLVFEVVAGEGYLYRQGTGWLALASGQSFTLPPSASIETAPAPAGEAAPSASDSESEESKPYLEAKPTVLFASFEPEVEIRRGSAVPFSVRRERAQPGKQWLRISVQYDVAGSDRGAKVDELELRDRSGAVHRPTAMGGDLFDVFEDAVGNHGIVHLSSDGEVEWAFFRSDGAVLLNHKQNRIRTSLLFEVPRGRASYELSMWGSPAVKVVAGEGKERKHTSEGGAGALTLHPK